MEEKDLSLKVGKGFMEEQFLNKLKLVKSFCGRAGSNIESS